MSNSRFTHVSLSIALVLVAQFFCMAFALHVVGNYGAESMDDLGSQEIVTIAPFTVGRFTTSLLLPDQTFVQVHQVAQAITGGDITYGALAVIGATCALPEQLCRNDLWLVYRTLLI
jgi:hypothetical protein